MFGPPPTGVIELGLGHAGLDEAGAECVYPNVSARELARAGLGDRVHAGMNPLSRSSEQYDKREYARSFASAVCKIG